MKPVKSFFLLSLFLGSILYILFTPPDNPPPYLPPTILGPVRDTSREMVDFDWYNNRYIYEEDLDSLMKYHNKYINKTTKKDTVKPQLPKHALPIDPFDIDQIFTNQ